jgi:hypothetical protein
MRVYIPVAVEPCLQLTCELSAWFVPFGNFDLMMKPSLLCHAVIRPRYNLVSYGIVWVYIYDKDRSTQHTDRPSTFGFPHCGYASLGYHHTPPSTWRRVISLDRSRCAVADTSSASIHRSATIASPNTVAAVTAPLWEPPCSCLLGTHTFNVCGYSSIHKDSRYRLLCI